MPPMLSSLASDVAAFRHFNRTYTKLIGTLEEGLLRTEYSLAEARILYEFGTSVQPKAKQVAATLGLDQGYLSRILLKFENRGLIKRKVSKEDNRSADIALTRKGRTAFETLNARSDDEARTILEPVSPSDRQQLIAAMKTIERVLLRKSDSAPFILRPHRPGDMGWVVHREAVLYAEEYGWDGSFETLVLQIATDFLKNFDAARERCWIAEIDGQHAGHIFLAKHPEQPDTAKLRLLMVEPRARGKGLGRALVSECVRFARSCGYRKVTLWTQSILVFAHRIYEQAGFRLVNEECHHSFGKDLTGQTWELEL